MTVAEVDSIGRGRTFTGAQALELRLIDQVGTFDDAVRLAKEKAGIPASEEVEYVHFPRKKGLLETLRSGGLSAAWNRLLADILRPWRGERSGTWAVDWTQYY